jgi:HSP20 family protein
MNRLFDGFDRGFLTEPFEGRFESFRPRVDVSETDKEIRIAAELPGMDERDIRVSVSKDALTIKGEKKEEKEDKGKAYYHMERSYGSFLRTIPLPAEVDSEKINAEFRKGILTVTMPKTAKAIEKNRKIPITAE